MILPDWIVLFMAIAGVCVLIAGMRRPGISLLLPAALRWIALPLLWPELRNIPIALILLAVPLIAVFGGLLLLDRAVSFVYGARAGGHVTGEYLVRTFDAIARSALWLVSLPFRLLLLIWRGAED
jgi:hypothetical protein